jgi:hypothetical protein
MMTAAMAARTPQIGEMLTLLERHKIQVRLDAELSVADVAQRTGFSLDTVRRVQRESAVTHTDDKLEHRQRRFGRPSVAAPFAERVAGWLQPCDALPAAHAGGKRESSERAAGAGALVATGARVITSFRGRSTHRPAALSCIRGETCAATRQLRLGRHDRGAPGPHPPRASRATPPAGSIRTPRGRLEYEHSAPRPRRARWRAHQHRLDSLDGVIAEQTAPAGTAQRSVADGSERLIERAA